MYRLKVPCSHQIRDGTCRKGEKSHNKHRNPPPAPRIRLGSKAGRVAARDAPIDALGAYNVSRVSSYPEWTKKSEQRGALIFIVYRACGGIKPTKCSVCTRSPSTPDHGCLARSMQQRREPCPAATPMLTYPTRHAHPGAPGASSRIYRLHPATGPAGRPSPVRTCESTRGDTAGPGGRAPSRCARAAPARRGRLRQGHGRAEMVRHAINSIVKIIAGKRVDQLKPRAHHGGVRGFSRREQAGVETP